ncbi:carbohydrate porin [Bradyrhizobium sp. JR3.5]
MDDANPNYLNVSQSALPVFYSGSTGLLIPAELAWLPKFGNLQGSYKFGGWYDTSTAPDVVTDVNGNPAVLSGQPLLQSRGRYGAYASFVQQVIRPSQASSAGMLSLFFNATMADRRTATTDYQIAGGLIYTGPFQLRPEDDIGFAVGTTHVNGRIAWSEELQNLAGLGTRGRPGQRIRHGTLLHLPATRRPAGATEHPVRDRPRWHQQERKRVGVRPEDGRELLTPERNAIQPRTRCPPSAACGGGSGWGLYPRVTSWSEPPPAALRASTSPASGRGEASLPPHRLNLTSS